MKQLGLMRLKKENGFGGSLLCGRRKSLRPLSFKKTVHLVLKVSDSFKLLRAGRRVEAVIRRLSRKFGVRVHSFAVHADHIHLSVKIPNREIYKRWIRGLTSLLVQRIRGLRWRLRPYTRIVSFGCDFETVQAYINHNKVEGEFLLSAHIYVEGWRNKVPDIGYTG